MWIMCLFNETKNTERSLNDLKESYYMIYVIY